MEAKSNIPSRELTPILLTGTQAAKLVNMCEKSLYLAARRGELRVVKLGRAVRYRPADLQAWVDSKVSSVSLGE